MSFNLEQKVVLVTGSSRGIGAGIAKCIVEHGGIPIVTYFKNKGLAEAFCRAHSIDDCFQMNALERSDIQRVLTEVTNKYGKIDGVVNNAGVLEQKPFLEISEQEWDDMLATNLKGPFLVVQESIKWHQKLDQGDLRIINISSVGGQFGGPKAPHYAASKGALLTFTKSMARIFSCDGVRVNAIAPGFIKTEMYEHILENQSESDILAGIPLGIVGEVEDVGLAAVYLCSEAGRYMSGQVLNINGGSYMP